MTLRRNRSLWSRAHARLALGDAKPEDTAEYVEHRTKLAGAATNPFGPDALVLLHEASGGRLRDIARIATDALERGARRHARKVDRTLLAHLLDSDSLE